MFRGELKGFLGGFKGLRVWQRTCAWQAEFWGGGGGGLLGFSNLGFRV